MFKIRDQRLAHEIPRRAPKSRKIRDIKLPKYEKWANYDAYLPMNIERYCDFYSLGI
jgi:hypothetical protein